MCRVRCDCTSSLCLQKLLVKQSKLPLLSASSFDDRKFLILWPMGEHRLLQLSFGRVRKSLSAVAPRQSTSSRIGAEMLGGFAQLKVPGRPSTRTRASRGAPEEPPSDALEHRMPSDP